MLQKSQYQLALYVIEEAIKENEATAYAQVLATEMAELYTSP